MCFHIIALNHEYKNGRKCNLRRTPSFHIVSRQIFGIAKIEISFVNIFFYESDFQSHDALDITQYQGDSTNYSRCISKIKEINIIEFRRRSQSLNKCIYAVDILLFYTSKYFVKNHFHHTCAYQCIVCQWFSLL